MSAMSRQVWSVGHSTRTAEQLAALLLAHGVETVADVRSYPGSRRCPWFGAERMPDWLTQAGISYVHLRDLGGRRGRQRSTDPGLNAGWANPAFRNYADYMTSRQFAAALRNLEQVADDSPTVFLCSEAVPWRCHRSLISDALTARGWAVGHILDDGPTRPHKPGAWGATPHICGDQVTYPAAQLAADAP